MMASSPSLFVDVISIVYREAAESADDGSDQDYHGDEEEYLTEEEREARSKRAENAYRLLSNWAAVPGFSDGAIDADVLNAWYDETRQALHAARRIAPGLRHVGQVLAGATAGEYELWPPLPVRDLIERVRDQELERGIYLGLVNQRGTTTRGLEEGGVQELDLAATFRADAERLAAEWPRTAAILRWVAQSYEGEARRNEVEAERRRQGLNQASASRGSFAEPPNSSSSIPQRDDAITPSSTPGRLR